MVRSFLEYFQSFFLCSFLFFPANFLFGDSANQTNLVCSSLSLHLARSVLLGHITLICPLLEGHFDTGPDSKMGNNAYPDTDHDPNHVKKMKNMLFTLNIL